MSNLNFDVILFTVFLIANLVIGLIASGRATNLRSYAIGNKDFSTATLISTIVATWYGGGFLFYTLANIYSKGLYYIVVVLGAAVYLLIIGQVLAVRMGEFLNNLSVGDVMGSLYGNKVRIVTATSSVLAAIGWLAIQFKVISRVLGFIFEIDGPWVTVIAAIIVISYSAFGGIRAVTYTDVFQFITFSIFIPILALIIWHSLKDPNQVINTLTTNANFNFREVVGWNTKFISSLTLMVYFAIPALYPPMVQRILMSRDINQVKAAFTYSSGIVLLVNLSLVWISILLLSHNPNLDPNSLVTYIINHYAYPGLKGLICIGIVAMAMSTADSDLNASSILIVNDIIKPLKPTWKESITTIRFFTFLLGSLAILLALRATDLLDLVLLSGSFYMPIITVPLLLAIFGFRSTSRSVLVGMAAGFVTVVVWKTYFTYTGINNVIPGMIGNLVFFVGSHYILGEKGGWIGIKDKAPLLAAKQARMDAWKGFINSIKRPQLYTFFQSNLPTKEWLYPLVGIYIIGSTYALFFTVPEPVVASYKTLYDTIAHSVLIIIFTFITYPAWPSSFKKKSFITLAWPIGIFYALFVVGSILIVLSNFHQVQVMIFMLNLVIAALLLSWPLVGLFLISGMMVTYTVFHFSMHTLHLSSVTNLYDQFKFSVIYGLLLFSSFLIALFKFKQSKTKLEERTTYLTNIQEATKQRLNQVLGYREELLKELNQDEILLLDSTTAAYIQQAIYRITDYLRLEVTNFNINELIDQVKTILKFQDLNSTPKLIINNHTKITTLQADLDKIKQLLVDSILYIQNKNKVSKPIVINLEDATLGYTIDHMKDYTKKIIGLKLSISIENNLPRSNNMLYMVSPTQAPSLNPQTDPTLLDTLRIIEAHYGYANLQETHIVYVIPVNVRDVRGNVMELLQEPAAVVPEEINHPLAIELEKKLLDKLQRTKVNMRIIHKALDTIKKYHGGVKRKSGEPFFTHPIQVALILMDYTQDEDAILAALLHDTVEDTQLSMAHIRVMFGEKVAFFVKKATNLEDKIKRIRLQEHETNYRLINYEDERAAFIKLSDRLHNMRTIQNHSSIDKQKHIANETLLFFVPMAKHLSMAAMAEELEKLCLKTLEQ